MTLQEVTAELRQALAAIPDPNTARGLSRQEQEDYAGRRSHLRWQTTQASLVWDRMNHLQKELTELREWRDTLVSVRAEMQAALEALEPEATVTSTPVGYQSLKLAISVCDHGAQYERGIAFTGSLIEYLTQRGVEPLPGERSVTSGRRLSIPSCDYRIRELEPQFAQAQTEWQRMERFVGSLAVTTAS